MPIDWDEIKQALNDPIEKQEIWKKLFKMTIKKEDHQVYAKDYTGPNKYRPIYYKGSSVLIHVWYFLLTSQSPDREIYLNNPSLYRMERFCENVKCVKHYLVRTRSTQADIDFKTLTEGDKYAAAEHIKKYSQIQSNMDCILWTQYVVNGYGCTDFFGQHWMAHRFVYMMHHQKILPPKIEVRHDDFKCQDKRCVNILHLNEGTHSQNMQDLYLSGKLKKGEKASGAIYSDKQLEEAKELLNEGKKRGYIAKKTGVSESQISILKRWGTRSTPKNYQRKGIKRLKSEQVRAIRKEHEELKTSIEELAIKFDSTEVAISNIISGKSFKNVKSTPELQAIYDEEQRQKYIEKRKCGVTKKIKISDNGCHMWQGKINGKYGITKWKGNISLGAHVLAWILWKNDGIFPPKGQVVRHMCNVHLCVNPNHLELGTQKENVEDQKIAGTIFFKHGERHPKALVSDEKRQEIIDRYKKEDAKSIAESMATLSEIQIHNIVNHARAKKRKLDQIAAS